MHKYLLDTNHCIFLINSRDENHPLIPAEENVVKNFNEKNTEDAMFYISEVTYGELYFGVVNSQRKKDLSIFIKINNFLRGIKSLFKHS